MAQSRALKPRLSLLLTVAPWLIKVSTAVTWPSLAAKWRGVVFCLSLGSILALKFTSRSMTLAWPLEAAQSNGVHRISFLGFQNRTVNTPCEYNMHSNSLIFSDTTCVTSWDKQFIIEYRLRSVDFSTLLISSFGKRLYVNILKVLEPFSKLEESPQCLASLIPRPYFQFFMLKRLGNLGIIEAIYYYNNAMYMYRCRLRTFLCMLRYTACTLISLLYLAPIVSGCFCIKYKATSS